MQAWFKQSQPGICLLLCQPSYPVYKYIKEQWVSVRKERWVYNEYDFAQVEIQDMLSIIGTRTFGEAACVRLFTDIAHRTMRKKKGRDQDLMVKTIQNLGKTKWKPKSWVVFCLEEKPYSSWHAIFSHLPTFKQPKFSSYDKMALVEQAGVSVPRNMYAIQSFWALKVSLESLENKQGELTDTCDVQDYDLMSSLDRILNGRMKGECFQKHDHWYQDNMREHDFFSEWIWHNRNVDTSSNSIFRIADQSALFSDMDLIYDMNDVSNDIELKRNYSPSLFHQIAQLSTTTTTWRRWSSPWKSKTKQTPALEWLSGVTQRCDAIELPLVFLCHDSSIEWFLRNKGVTQKTDELLADSIVQIKKDFSHLFPVLCRKRTRDQSTCSMSCPISVASTSRSTSPPSTGADDVD